MSTLWSPYGKSYYGSLRSLASMSAAGEHSRRDFDFRSLSLLKPHLAGKAHSHDGNLDKLLATTDSPLTGAKVLQFIETGRFDIISLALILRWSRGHPDEANRMDNAMLRNCHDTFCSKISTPNDTRNIKTFVFKLVDNIEIQPGEAKDYLMNAALGASLQSNLLKLILFFSPESISPATIMAILHRLYQSGITNSQQGRHLALDIVPYLRDSESVLLANFLFASQPTPLFKDQRLLKLASKDSKTLSLTFISLFRRNRFIEAINLAKFFIKEGQKDQHNSDSLAVGVNNKTASSFCFPHLCIAFLSAVMQGDRPSAFYFLGLIKSQRFPLLKQLKNTRRLPKQECSHEDGRWLALSLAAKDLIQGRKRHLEMFLKRFFFFFDERCRPNACTASFFLQILISQVKQSREDAAMYCSFEWLEGFIFWLQKRGVPMSLTLLAQIARLVQYFSGIQQTAASFWLTRQLSQTASVQNLPVMSLFKELCRCADKAGANSLALKEIISAAENSLILLPIAFYSRLIELALREGRCEFAGDWTLKCIKNGQRLSNHQVSLMFSTIRKQAPLEYSIKLANSLKEADYPISNDIFSDLLDRAIVSNDFEAARSLFAHIRPSHLLRHHGLEIAQKAMELAITLGHVNYAHHIWSETLRKTKTFDEILAQVATSDIFSKLLQSPKPFDLRGASEAFGFALAKNYSIEANWCVGVLENCLTMGNFELASSIHLYLVTRREFMPKVALRVSFLWMLYRNQSQHSSRNEMNS